MADWTSMARNLFRSDRTAALVPARIDCLHPTQRRWSVAEKIRMVSECWRSAVVASSCCAAPALRCGPLGRLRCWRRLQSAAIRRHFSAC